MPHQTIRESTLFGKQAPDPKGWFTSASLKTLLFSSYFKGLRILIFGATLIIVTVAVHEWVTKDEGFSKIIEHNIGPEFTAQKILQMLQQPRNEIPRRPETHLPRALDPAVQDEQDERVDENDEADRLARDELLRQLRIDRARNQREQRRIRQMQEWQEEQRRQQLGGGENVFVEFSLTPLFLIKVAWFLELMVVVVLGVFYFLPSLLGMISLTAIHSLVALSYRLVLHIVQMAGIKFTFEYSSPLTYLPSVDLSSLQQIYSNIVNWTPEAEVLERTLVLAAGYLTVGSAIAAIMHLLESGCSPVNPLSRGYRAIYIALLEVVCTLKVLSIFCIELLIFPIFCGLQLDFVLAPVLTENSFFAMFDINSPYKSALLVLGLGTYFMYVFASFVSMARSDILRKGVLFFIRSPDDPNVRLIHDALMKPFGLQISRIALSGLVYTIYIAVEFAAVTWGLKYLVPYKIFPIRYTISGIWSVIPPLVRSIATQPSFAKLFRAYWQMAFRQSCSLLRLSSFILGADVPEERGHVVYRSLVYRLLGHKPEYNSPVPETETAAYFQEHPEATCCFVPDGTFVRAPDDDNVSRSFIRKLFVPVTKNDVPLAPVPDDEDETEAKNNPYGDEELVSITSYTIVYRPPNFKPRIFALLGCLWAYSLALGALVFGATLLFARVVLRPVKNTMLHRLFFHHDAETLDANELFVGFVALAAAVRCLIYFADYKSSEEQQDLISYIKKGLDSVVRFVRFHVLPTSRKFAALVLTPSVCMLSTVLPVVACAPALTAFESRVHDIGPLCAAWISEKTPLYSVSLFLASVVHAYTRAGGALVQTWHEFMFRSPGYFSVLAVQLLAVVAYYVLAYSFWGNKSVLESFELVYKVIYTSDYEPVEAWTIVYFTWLPWSLYTWGKIVRDFWNWLIITAKNQHYGKRVFLTNNEEEDLD
ncbi:hypothetical protein KL942_003724 [Ogataea angusta]|uniref:RING-type E3 ubiquitin transferase n=1 Tax=Pichia angusta TaxID=870730 RepID=A0ABQ7RWT2_PICAN|nr:hypothetical protein KL942_003724 [Ogataea angusta]KAG7849528.1 hypothetical protein KL940_002558 [Ogataea angusta]